jgi:hypothetical protein
MNVEILEETDFPKTPELTLVERVTWYFDSDGRRQHIYRGGESGLAAASKILRQRGIEPHGDWPEVIAHAIALTPVIYLDNGRLAPRGN